MRTSLNDTDMWSPFPVMCVCLLRVDVVFVCVCGHRYLSWMFAGVVFTVFENICVYRLAQGGLVKTAE